VTWVKKALADGATQIRYVTPDKSKIPQAAFDQIEHYRTEMALDILVEEVPFK